MDCPICHVNVKIVSDIMAHGRNRTMMAHDGPPYLIQLVEPYHSIGEFFATWCHKAHEGEVIQ